MNSYGINRYKLFNLAIFNREIIQVYKQPAITVYIF